MEPSPALYAAWPGRATQIDMLWSYFVASDATQPGEMRWRTIRVVAAATQPNRNGHA